MDVIQQCFEQHNFALTRRLIGAEFSIDQARHFLPVAASGLFESTQKNSVYQTIACLLSRCSYELMRKIDIDSMSRNAGMNAAQVTAGLYAIAPVLLQAIAQQKLNMNSHDSSLSINSSV